MLGKLDKLIPPRQINSGTDLENSQWEEIERELDEEEGVIEVVLSPFDEQFKKDIEQILRDVRDEDKDVRDDQIRIWKKLEFYWNNILDIFLDPVARDWRVPTQEEWEEIEETKPRAINIFRPHGEAIVAALSVVLPPIIFYPDDAESPDDLETARAFRSISELLARHNDSQMLFIRSIVIMLLQGTVFGYNYFKEDKKYGTIDRPKVTFKNFKTYDVYCQNCGEPVDGLIDAPPESDYTCMSCGYVGPGAVSQQEEMLPDIEGTETIAKSSVCQEVFSALNVKIPYNSKKQEECGYLLLEFHQSTAMLRGIFTEKADKIEDGKDYSDNSTASIPSQYRHSIPQNTAKVSALWIRPWQFWMLGRSDEVAARVKSYIKRYPTGCYAIFVNDELMEHAEENLDDHWTISKNPLGESLLSRPLAENLATVQDIRADLVELELQTVEHGIPETFVDPKVLDFEEYGKGISKPGMITQATPRSGRSLSDAFFTTKTAILSQEVDPIRQHIDQDAQFVLGSFPSVYGGPATGGSKTASEYSQSKSMALQRLGTTYKILCEFYADFQYRSVIEYSNILREEQRDEKVVAKDGTSFVNRWIRFTSLTGKIGRVEPEATEQLPASWAQKKDAIFQLMQTGVPELMQLLTHPRNIDLVKSAIGLQDIYIPGEDARDRQIREFVQMSQGMQIPVNPDLDNHPVHIEVLQTILESTMSDMLDPNAREICMVHLNEHQQVIAQQQMQAQAAAQPQAQQPETGPKEKQNA